MGVPEIDGDRPWHKLVCLFISSKCIIYIAFELNAGYLIKQTQLLVLVPAFIKQFPLL